MTRLQELQAKDSLTESEAAELATMLQSSNNENSKESRKADLEGYGYFAGTTRNTIVRDGKTETYQTAAFDIAIAGKVQHVVMAVSDDSVTAAKLSSFGDGAPVHVSFASKTAGSSYTTSDGATREYRRDGYMLINISKASKAIVDSKMLNKTQVMLDTLISNGMSKEDALALMVSNM